MAFVVYHVKSTHMFRMFNSEASAKRSTTCANRNAGRAGVYAYASESVYNSAVVKMKTVRNLMSGKEIQIASNTPLSCDPSSETYWSM